MDWWSVGCLMLLGEVARLSGRRPPVNRCTVHPGGHRTAVTAFRAQDRRRRFRFSAADFVAAPICRFTALLTWPRAAPIHALAALRNRLMAGFLLSHGFLIACCRQSS
jgi:hypothetical protein